MIDICDKNVTDILFRLDSSTTLPIERVFCGNDLIWGMDSNDFVLCEYIENISNAYIDTNVNFSVGLKIEIDAVYTDRYNSVQIIAAAGSGGGLWLGNVYINGNGQFGLGETESMIIGDSSVRTIMTIEYLTARTSLTGNELTVYQNRNSDPINNTIHLFAYNGNYTSSAKIYNCKIYDGETLIRDFVPMFQISTKKYGLFDRVNNIFYTSNNSDDFVGGQYVLEDLNGDLYYIKNYILTYGGSGKKYCSIGITPNETDYFKTKIYLPTTGRNYPCGGWSSNNSNDYGLKCLSSSLRFHYDTKSILYSGSYGNKTFTFKEFYDNSTETMHFYIYNASGKLIFHTTSEKQSGTSSKSFLIGDYNGSTYGSTNNTRFYYFLYWRNNILIRDMIPVQSVNTGEYGMFDKINKKIYYSTGGEPFTGA